jgi:acetyl esterase/lipase
MSLDPRVNRFLELFAATKPRSALETSVAERRQGLADLLALSGPEWPVARVEDRLIPGPGGPLPVRLYTPFETNTALLPGLVYFHGGGFVAGSIDTHDPIARALTHGGKCRVISVGYRLAPEHRFPAAVADALQATRHIGAHAAYFGIDAARLGICGDSAGGTLVAATCQSLAREGFPPLRLQLLLCPILDYSRSTASKREFASGYLVDQATLDHDLLHYLPPATDCADPRISPLNGLEGPVPFPTIIHTADCDPLRDEGHLYAERLSRLGSAVHYQCHPGMVHMFYGLGGVIPYARRALMEIGTQIEDALRE